jgi:glyoxylase-like metal-dependent hydrolase (beta-lactamase superfamily II)
VGWDQIHMLKSGYLERLRATGIGPDDVDVVLCTHLHADHVGWNTRLQDGLWVPTFPNARYITSATELAHVTAQAAPEGLAGAAFRDSVLPIVDAGLVTTVDGGHELDQVLTIHPAPGHTPGHVRVELRSREELGILCGDIVHSPLQVTFWDWRTALSADPAQDVRTGRTLLEDCAEHGALLLTTHFGGSGPARIRGAGDGFTVDLKRPGDCAPLA